MVMLETVAATNTHTDSLEEEDAAPEDFEVLIDEPHLAVVRVGTQVVAEVYTPLDLTDLGFRLASEGYVIQEMIAFHDGVIEMLLRPLGYANVADTAIEQKRMQIIREYMEVQEEREKIYA